MPVFSRKAQDAAFKLRIHSTGISTSFSQPSIPQGRAGPAEAGLARVTRGRNRWLSHEAFGGLLGSCPVWFPPPPPRKSLSFEAEIRYRLKRK